MKKLLSIILLLCVFIQLSACGDNDTGELHGAADFYYLTEEVTYHSENGLIASEKRDANNYYDDLSTLLNQYLQGPDKTGLVSPFPENTTVSEITHNNGILSIELSKEFGQINGYDLSVACACLTLTVQQFVTVNLVQISAEGVDLDGNKYITMNTDSLLLIDNPVT